MNKSKVSLCLLLTLVLALGTMTPVVHGSSQRPPQPSSEEYEVRLKSRQFVPEPRVDSGLVTSIQEQPAERAHVLLQFDSQLDATLKTELSEAGVEILHYMPRNTWIASVPAEFAASPPSYLRWMGQFQVADKIEPDLLEGGPGSWARNPDGTHKVKVTFFDDVPTPIARDILNQHDAAVEAEFKVSPSFYVSLDERELENLAANDEVSFIGFYPPPPTVLNDGSRDWTNTDAVHGMGLEGDGINLGIWDEGPVDEEHDDFADRLTIVEDTEAVSDHATHVAGTMAGAGAVNSDLTGHAPAAHIFSYDFNGVTSNEMEEAVSDHGIHISNNSWGRTIGWYWDSGQGQWNFLDNQGLFGSYDLDAPEYDSLVREQGLIIVKSSGNDRNDPTDGSESAQQPADWDQGEGYGGYHTVGPRGCAKNVITVGAIRDGVNVPSHGNEMTGFSNWGPTDDGRLKPDVVAPGEDIESCDDDPNDSYFENSGTSMAAPAVSGIAALVLEQYNDTYSAEPLPSTVKAVLIGTATDLDDNTDHHNPGPDYASGYGLVDAEAAVELVATNQQIREGDFDSAGITRTYHLVVPENSNEVKLTLAWDDEEAAGGAAETLVNDLDLTVVDADSQVHYPWVLDPDDPDADATTGEDHINNVEQVLVQGTPVTAGIWEVRIHSENLGPDQEQSYSLVANLPLIEASIEAGLQWLRDHQNPDGSWTYSGRFTEENVGLTSIATIAFLNHGVTESDPTVDKAVDWLLGQQNPDGSISSGNYAVYDTSLATLALVAARNQDYYTETKSAVGYLIDLQNDEDEGYAPSSQHYGGWAYPRDNWADLSNSQFVMLALWYAEDFDSDDAIVPADVWDKAEIFVTRCQNREASNPDFNFYDDGGFIYRPDGTNWAGGESYGSMTTAGLWGLFTCGVDEGDGRVQDAWGWLEDNYYVDQNYPIGTQLLYYYLYGLSKAGMLWKVDAIGGHDWYQEMSEVLVDNQQADGHWPGTHSNDEPDNVATCWALLALESKQTAPGTGLHIELHSPADLHLYDPQGRHVGINYDTGDVEIEIPGATYSGPDSDPQVIDVPDPLAGDYRVELVGREQGDFTLIIEGTLDDTTLSSRSIEGSIEEGETKAVEFTVSGLAGPITIDIPDTIPPEDVEDLAVTDQTEDSATLTWTAPGDDWKTGTASEYDIRYSTEPITEDNWDQATQCDGEPTPQPAGSSESFTVTGLDYGVHYFAVKTADEVPNWSGLSNVAELVPIGGVTYSGASPRLLMPWAALAALACIILAGGTVAYRRRGG